MQVTLFKPDVAVYFKASISWLVGASGFHPGCMVAMREGNAPHVGFLPDGPSSRTHVDSNKQKTITNIAPTPTTLLIARL